ncbi:MAG: glutamate--cysteine ligase, partial [Betaproteobacteria bacterium]
RLEWMEHTPPFYCAVDIRNAGFKLAPVDTNLFPSGWNNLTPEMLPLAVQAAMAAIEKICPEARNLLVVPAGQTRSTFYLANVLQLKRIFHQTGLNVRFGSLSPDIKEPTTYDLPTGESITIEPLMRSDRRLGLKDFDPCTILLNNELSAGVPGILEELHEQYLLPPLHASASVRRKSQHFQIYEEICKRFAKLLGIDPWLINPMFSRCGPVGSTGREALSVQVDALLTKIRRKYKEYGINEKPFVVVKADGQADGLGIVTVRDVKDLESLSLPAVPEGLPPPEVIVQEGVLTNERVNEAVAEPVVYLMDRYVVGGFYRIHAERGVDESLNTPGASFVPLAFADSGRLPQAGERPGSSSPNRFYMYGVIGRLALLAASYELESTDPHAEVYD